MFFCVFEYFEIQWGIQFMIAKYLDKQNECFFTGRCWVSVGDVGLAKYKILQPYGDIVKWNLKKEGWREGEKGRVWNSVDNSNNLKSVCVLYYSIFELKPGKGTEMVQEKCGTGQFYNI